MAKPVTTLLSRHSTPESIEDDLATLWRDAAREGPVMRAVMANLVVFCQGASPGCMDVPEPISGASIEDVAVRCPARVIVLHHTAKATPSKPVDATTRILLFGPPGMRTGIEEIALRSTCCEDSLPSIVRHFVLGDIPTAVWWAEDLSTVEPLDGIVEIAQLFLYDSRQWRNIRAGVASAARVASLKQAPNLVDLNWRRLKPMRKALVHAAAPGGLGATRTATPVRIRHRPGGAALAWLVAGWFAAKLGLPSGDWPIEIEEGRHRDEMLVVSLGAEVTATLSSHSVLVKYSGDRAPFSVTVPHDTMASAIAAELRTPSRDTCLHETVAALARRFASS